MNTPRRNLAHDEAGALAGLAGRRVLVTGGAGFIGSHLVDALLGLGARVRVIDDFSTGLESNLADATTGATAGSAEVIRASIVDAEACRRACRDIELVFHQAALGSVPRSMKDPASTFAANVTGTANIFAAARDAGAERVVYASSSSVYGDSEVMPRREGHEGRALSPYALSKQMCETLAAHFASVFDLTAIGLRYFNVFGPRQRPDGPYAAVVPRFVASARADEPAIIHGDGGQSRDFTFVLDAVRANLFAGLAEDESIAGQAFNVGCGDETTVLALATMIRESAGGPAPVFEPSRAGDVRQSMASLEAVTGAIGYRPTVSLRDGLARLLAS